MEKLSALAVFHNLCGDPVLSLLETALSPEGTPAHYARFANELFSRGGDLGLYIEKTVLEDENPYIAAVARGRQVPPELERDVQKELAALQEYTELDRDILRKMSGFDGYMAEFASSKVDLKESYRRRCLEVGKKGYGKYAAGTMFAVNGEGRIVPVKYPDPVRLSQLVDYRREQGLIIQNTKALLAGLPAANMLLTGDAGTGKSSTVKAVANEFSGEGLRLVEIKKNQLGMLQEIMAELSEIPLKFVIFIDDISFSGSDDAFNALKGALEGSVSVRARNVAIYATSNRRHLVEERFSDREGDEVHRRDVMEQQSSLADRFGGHVLFKRPDKATYLNIVRRLAEQEGVKKAEPELFAEAERYALEKGGRSARNARYFVDSLSRTNAENNCCK